MPTYTSRSRCAAEQGKLVYSTEQDAADALERFQGLRESGQVHRHESRAYLCPHDLEHWHLTSLGTATPKGPAQTPPTRVKGPPSNYWAPDELELLQQPFTVYDVTQLTGRTYWAVARKLHQLDRAEQPTALLDGALAVAQHRAIGRDFRLTAAELDSLGRELPCP